MHPEPRTPVLEYRSDWVLFWLLSPGVQRYALPGCYHCFAGCEFSLACYAASAYHLLGLRCLKKEVLIRHIVPEQAIHTQRTTHKKQVIRWISSLNIKSRLFPFFLHGRLQQIPQIGANRFLFGILLNELLLITFVHMLFVFIQRFRDAARQTLNV